jgi:hypothetical protein
MQELMQQINSVQVQTERDVYYGRTQLMLQALKLGTITLDQITVTPNGWSLVPKVEESAPTPAPEG